MPFARLSYLSTSTAYKPCMGVQPTANTNEKRKIIAISAREAAGDLAMVVFEDVVGSVMVVVLRALRIRMIRKRMQIREVEMRSCGRRPQWSV
jgi:hypothetical protein